MLAVVHYMQGESKELQMQGHKDVETAGLEALQNNWREYANLGKS